MGEKARRGGGEGEEVRGWEERGCGKTTKAFFALPRAFQSVLPFMF